MDAYKVLGLKPGASLRELKTAYRKQAMIHHPDRGGSNEKFNEIQQAYEYLCKIGDHVPLRKTASQSSNFVAKIIKGVYNDMSEMVVDKTFLAVDAYYGRTIKKGTPPGAKFINYETSEIVCANILLPEGYKFRNKFDKDEMFIGDIVGQIQISTSLLNSGGWIRVKTPFEEKLTMVRIPAKSKHGGMLIVSGKGYWNWKRGPISKADLILYIEEVADES